MMRLNKYIASCGYCSRRKADDVIKSGAVNINGENICDIGHQVNEKSDIVKINGKVIKIQESKVYIMLNKPVGYVTTNIEQANRKCTNDLIHEKVRVFPIGRLDMDSEGLLLFTNDGEFANNLMHPSMMKEKTYIVKVNRKIKDESLVALQKGIDIGGYITKPAKVERVASNVFKITITEGKNRQIRKMCLTQNLRVEKLKRIRIGNIELGNLPVGKYRYLNKKEINELINR